MIDESRALKYVEQISSLGKNELSALSALCHICCIQLSARLKKKESEKDSRIVFLAAAKTYLNYLLRYCDNDEVSSVKAGDVTVSSDANAKIKKAQMLVDEAEKEAIKLFADDEFVFSGV